MKILGAVRLIHRHLALLLITLGMLALVVVIAYKGSMLSVSSSPTMDSGRMLTWS